MNLFYDEYPCEIEVNGEEIPIITDFREHVKLIDMLNDAELEPTEKAMYIMQYFKENPGDYPKAIEKLTEFVNMSALYQAGGDSAQEEEQRRKKDLYSFSIDYPFIFSAFLHDYGINIRTIPYMHWWEFRLLFDGLSEDTEIKQRIMYRNIDLADIKDPEERKRISKIQKSIKLPDGDILSDFEIGEAFGW